MLRSAWLLLVARFRALRLLDHLLPPALLLEVEGGGGGEGCPAGGGVGSPLDHSGSNSGWNSLGVLGGSVLGSSNGNGGVVWRCFPKVHES